MGLQVLYIKSFNSRDVIQTSTVRKGHRAGVVVPSRLIDPPPSHRVNVSSTDVGSRRTGTGSVLYAWPETATPCASRNSDTPIWSMNTCMMIMAAENIVI